MKKASKTLAVLLSVLLLFSFGTTVFADETSAPDFDAASSSTESSAEPSDEPSAAPETSEVSESSEVSAPESAEPETSGTESSSTESSEESAVTETKVQTYANAGEEPVAKIGETPYASLQEAVNAASASDQATTITLVADIADIHASDIVTIPSEANLTLDMNEKKITVASDFTGRPLINRGTLTITGNGTIDSSASNTGGYGAVDNYGVLTIENGTFTGSVNASGASIKNRPDATLTIYDGLFNGAVTAVYNAGKTYIHGGTFDCRSCSNQNCNPNSWGYTIQSHMDIDGKSPELYFYDGTVIGVQGAFSTSAGYSEIQDGSFKTVPCSKQPDGSTAFYALYIAGESGEVESNIYGGTFESASRVAAFIGNSNDGGDKLNAIAHFYGGSFTSGGNSEAVHVDSSLGGLEITGGTYSSDVSAYTPDGYASIDADGSFTIKPATEPTDDSAAEVGGIYYKSVQNAVNAADDGAVVKLVKDTAETIVVSEGQNIVLDLNGKKLTGNTSAHTISVAGGTLSVKDSTAESAPSVSSDYKVSYTSGAVEASSKNAVAVYGGGSFTLESGTLISTGNCGIYAGASDGGSGTAVINGGYIHAREFGVGVMMEGSSVTVNGGVIEADDNAVVASNGTKGYGGTEIDINGGTLIGHIETGGYIACGIYHPQSGMLNISGGTIYADNGVGVLIRAGSANITGGEIIATGIGDGKVGDSTVPSGHYGVLFDTSSGYGGMTDQDVVKISGNASIKSEEPSLSVTDSDDNHRIEVSGGTFSSNVKDFVVEGNTAVEDENGNFVIAADPETAVAEMNGKGYMSLQEAITAAGTDAAAVKLLKNTKEDVVIPESANITLEIPENVTLTNASGHTITNNGTFKLTGKGTIDNTTHARGALVNYGTAVLEGTTLTRSAEASTSATDNGGNSWYVIYNGGEMTITGTTDVVNKGYYSSLICNKGESAESPASLTVSGGTIEQQNFIAVKNDDFGKLSITGGEISSDDQAVQNWSDAEISGGTLNGNVSTWAYDGGAASKTVISGTAVITGNVMAVNFDNQDTIPTVVIQGGTVNGKLEKATYNNLSLIHI